MFRFIYFGVIMVLFAHCKKSEDAFTVYRPPIQKVVFSEVTDLLLDSTGKSVTIKAKVSAEDGFEKIEILYAPWNLSKTINNITGTSYNLNEAIVIPSNASLQIHSVRVKATDKKGIEGFVDIKIGLQNLNYPQLYLADVEGNTSLSNSLFGMPLVMDKIGSHSYELIYYARNNNINIRFLPIKTSFTPVAIGLDPSNRSKLITDGSKSLPITISNRGYYKISVNTLLLTYSISSFTPSGTAFNQVALAGRGFFDFPNMNYQNVLPNIILLDKDPANPFLFTKQVRLGIPAGQNYNTAQFIFTTNNGWTNFWRFDNSNSPEKAVFNGGFDASIPITSTPVSYLFIFDSFTNRVQAIKQ